MAQKIKRRLFSGRKIIPMLLALILIGAALLAMTVFAEGDVIITVGSAEGYEGDRVEIPVTIDNRSGAAGAEFRIYYDGSKVEVPWIEDPYEPGEYYPDVTLGVSLFNPQAMPLLIANVGSDGNGDYVAIAAVSARAMIDDGVICTIGFELKSKGTTNLELANVKVSDAQSADLPFELVDGTITVKSHQLDQVEKPTWDGNTIKWNGVANASSYIVNLYKDSVWTWNGVVNESARSLNLGNYMSDNGPGSYTATVKALATAPYTNGPESDHSEAKTYSVTLGKVGQPAWGTGWTITWNDLADGSPDYGDHVLYYHVNLEKEGSSSTLKTVGVNPSLKQYTFDSGDFDGPGSYYVTVQAIGDNILYFSGPLSDASAAKVRKEQLGQVSQPTWDATELGLIKWSAVENAAQYKVELLKGGVVAKTETKTVLNHNFLNDMRTGGVGSYTVRVTALAAAGSNYEDGPSSAVSEARVVSKLSTPAQPAFSSQGVATWSAVTGANGYTVNLYKGSTLVEGYTTSPTDNREYDFFWAVLENGPGSYTVKVVAMGTGYNLNSDESAASDPQEAAALAAPTGLAWKSDTEPELSWSAVAGAEGYKVQLCIGGTAVGGPVSLAKTVTSYDFATAIGSVAGYYTATVSAVGDGYFALDSPYAESGEFTKTGPLGQVTNLALSDKGVATWVDVADADSFVLQLYNDSDDPVGSSRSVAKGVQSANFRDAMRDAGVGGYYVTVIAKGSGLFSDGPAATSGTQSVSKLDDPAGVSLSNQGVSTWDAVAGATQYEVTLHLPAGHPEGATEVVVKTDELTLNHLALMRQYPGDYKITVIAQDTVGLYLDSDGADSGAQTVQELGQVQKPVLSDMGVATWDDVANAVGYAVSLYKDGEMVAEETAPPGVENFDFLNDIKSEGLGSYTVTIQAMGDGYLLLNGEPSAASDTVTATVLPKVNKPVVTVDNDTGLFTVEWDAVAGATSYLFTLYNGSGHEIQKGQVSDTFINSLIPDDPAVAGFYWFTVQALGAGVVLDGPESEISDILVVFGFSGGYSILGLDPPANDYVAEGWLPVPGYLWMRITSETGNDGVMIVESSASGAPNAPEGLTAAGVFYDIELDKYLAGSHVLIKAGYDHVNLPQGMVETSLRLYRYDAVKGWVLLDSTVDTSGKIVTAEVDHFSTVGIFGETAAPPAADPGDEKPKGELPRTFGYISLLLLGSLILVAAGLLFFRRRKALENR